MSITGAMLTAARSALAAANPYAADELDDTALYDALTAALEQQARDAVLKVGDTVEPARCDEPDRAAVFIDDDGDTWRFDAEDGRWFCSYLRASEPLKLRGGWEQIPGVLRAVWAPGGAGC